MIRQSLLVLAIALTACSGDDGGGTTTASSGGGGMGGSGGAGESTLTVSGALTGSRSAPAPGTSWGSANNVGAFNISAQFGEPFMASIAFTFDGEPTATSYTEATAGVSCAVSVAESATPTNTWMAIKAVSGQTDRGTCSLTLTAVTLDLELASQRQYSVHGSMEATLPVAVGMGSGPVTLVASF